MTPLIKSKILLSALNACGKWAPQCPLRWASRAPHSHSKTIVKMTHVVHVLPASADNYMYVITDKKTTFCSVVDPIEPLEVLDFVDRENLTLNSILTTHHLPDHSGGNKALADLYQRMPIYGGDRRVQGVNRIVGNGELIKVGKLRVKCLLSPQEASGHIIYYIRGDRRETPSAFVGDTILVAGVGNFHESNEANVLKAVYQTIGKLPSNTDLFCGHEHTVSNLKFALSLEPNNESIKRKLGWAEVQRSNKVPTVPSTISEERLYNPYIRIKEPSIMNAMGTTTPEETMAALRERRANCKPGPDKESR